jgi:uncharacterized protein YcsI (UPF0317 family)
MAAREDSARRTNRANLVILPKEAAVEFAAFCTRNPKPCPLIEITPPGDPEPAHSAPGADLRTDLPGYRVYRRGQLVEQQREIRDLWRDDLVAFLLSCSLIFEHALIEAGVSVRNVERGTLVPMFVSSITCCPAGRFHGPMVVTMRPIPQAQVQLVGELCARYPHAHGAPPSTPAVRKLSGWPTSGAPTTAIRSTFVRTKCRSSGLEG